MNNSGQKPDISFVDTNPEKLINSMILSYEVMAGRKLYPADPVRTFILWIADILVQERVIINESAKQNIPRYAEGEYLDSLAKLLGGAERLGPSRAVTTIRFHLEKPRVSAQTIPRGTRITADGTITFETETLTAVPPEADYADARAVCLLYGEAGNGFTPGQIAQQIDVLPFCKRAENITTSEGGAEGETDEAFRERMRAGLASLSSAGSESAYIYWAKTASQKITDVCVTSPLPGTIDIRILTEDGHPDAEMIRLVQEKLKGNVPMTDSVTISAPDALPFSVDAVYYISRQAEAEAEHIRSAAQEAALAYVKWQTGKMGRDINPDELRYLLKAAGVKRIEIGSPVYKTAAAQEAAILENIQIIYGGAEDG